MRKGRATHRTCRACGEHKEIAAFTHRSKVCDMCKEQGKHLGNAHDRQQQLLNELTASVRYKNAHVVKGYKFTGKVPPPRGPEYYKPNN